MSTLIVVEQGVSALIDVTSPFLRSVPRRERRLRFRGRVWHSVAVEAALDVLGAQSGDVVVLARRAVVDPGGAGLRSAALLLGVTLLDLPDDIDEAAWSTGMAVALAPAGGDALVRALEVVCCGPSIAAGLPTRTWGRRQLSVPALRPVTLARWAGCAWRGCSWCTAGGFPGHPCRRCGARIDATCVDRHRP